MRTRKLDPIEVRVLGSLMEKQQTTPASYPMTINAVIAACNQKSNRDPVTRLSETEVVEALDRLRQDVLAWRSEGARAERWEHRLDRRWELTPASKAVLCLLMLRGPQTAGELRTRSERLHRFASVGEVEETLRELAEAFDVMVRELPRQPGKRENRWTHLVCTEDPVEALEASPPPSPAPAPAAREAPPAGPSPTRRLEELEARIATLEEELKSLRIRLGDLDEPAGD